MRLITIVVVLLLSGCALLKPEPIIITETKVTYKPLPSHLLKSCEPPVPIAREEYLAKDVVDREIWLAGYTVSLLQEIGLCNNQIEAIKDFDDKHKLLYK